MEFVKNILKKLFKETQMVEISDFLKWCLTCLHKKI